MKISTTTTQSLFLRIKDTFDMDDFTNEVMIEPDIIEKFHHYKQRCEDESGTSINNSFSISETARKKQQRSFKRVIQLDKKIKIVIDGNSQNIEQGTDKKGKFYKVYYNEEKQNLLYTYIAHMVSKLRLYKFFISQKMTVLT